MKAGKTQKREKKTAKKATKKAKTIKKKSGSPRTKVKNDFRAQFLEHLLARKSELEEALGNLTGNQKAYEGDAGAGDYTDEVDGAQREISAQSYYQLIERKGLELKKIDRLIQRVEEEGEFGLCEECGKPIPEERLLIIPEATLCVPCRKELEEMGLI